MECSRLAESLTCSDCSEQAGSGSGASSPGVLNVSEQGAVLWTEVSGEQRSAPLYVSLPSVALNGARTRGQRRVPGRPLDDGLHC